MKNKKLLTVLIIALIAFVFIIPILPIRGEEAVYEKVIRLHVLANSDSSEDQSLKLLVRDGILGYVGELTEDCKNVDEAREMLGKHLDEITDLSDNVLKQNGSNDRCKVELGN